MALLAIPKIGSWNLNDLVKDPNGNEFQEFLQHTDAIIDEVEDKRKDLHNNISASDFENLLHLIENISERVSIATGYAHLRYSADTACNETASLVTRMDQLEIRYFK
jgi:oligoendopeptidase F